LLGEAPRLPAQETPPQEDKVLTYLGRFGLADYQILHLEREVYQRGRAAAAGTLASAYASELLRLEGSADDRGTDLETRLRKLIAAHPKVETDETKVMLLQREYAKAEALAFKWIDDPEQKQARADAVQELARIAPALQQLRDKLHEAAEQDEKLKQSSLRAAFASGWANYLHGVLRQQDEAKTSFQAARVSFKGFFGLAEDERPAKATTAESASLERPARARAALGVMLSELALGDTEAASPWIRLLQDPAVDPLVRDDLRWWLVWAFLQRADTARAKAEAEREIAEFTQGAFSRGKILLCYVLIREGFARDAGQDALRREFGQMGLRGLIKMRQFDLVRKQMDKYQIRLDEKAGFLFHWVQAQAAVEKASKSKSAPDCQSAIKALEAALAAPDAAQEPHLSAEGRRQLGWFHGQLGQLDTAVREITVAAEALKKLRAPGAAEVAWEACKVHLNLASKSSEHRDAAIRALEAFKRDFPDSPEVLRADFRIGQLKFDVQQLRAVPPQAANYADARFLLCQRAYDHWVNVRGDATRGSTAAVELKKDLDTFLALPVAAGTVGRWREALLWSVELALVGPARDRKQAQAQMLKVEPLVVGLSPDDTTVQHYRYWKLRLTQSAKDDAGAREHAAWLMQHAKGTVYERPAVVIAAENIHTRLEKSTGGERARLLEEGLQLYRRLVELSGAAALKSDRNAKVASSRLAQYAFELGDYETAAQQYDRLLEVEEDNAAYLRQGALAHFRLRDFGRSLEIWRKLLGSRWPEHKPPAWFEAKYYVVACLARIDVARAKDAFRQFKLLYPDLGPSPWREEFQKLERVLSN
jgi:tetratricopeptide (TPR) repeat protein